MHCSPIASSLRFLFDSCAQHVNIAASGAKYNFQTKEKVLTAARNAGKIDMSLPEHQIWRQAMAQARGSSVDELAARGAAKVMITFTATEDDNHLDVMRREEFEATGKILHNYSDRSTM